MDQSLGNAIIEGVGNEVLVTFTFGGIVLLLALAWYSTNLTHSQRHLTVERVIRSSNNVTYIQHHGSSSAELRAPQQSEVSPSTETSEVTNSTGETTDSQLAGASTQEGDDAETIEGADTLTQTEQAVTVDTESDESLRQSDVPDAAVTSTSCATAEPPSDGLSSGTDTSSKAAHSQQQSSITASHEKEPTPAGELDTIQLRIKFLNENERLVRACQDHTVQQFKQRHFAPEIADNKLVRLIFNGQVLQDEKTLRSYNVIENTAIHALISEIAAPNAANQSAAAPDEVGPNAGVLMVPLFTMMLGIIWYLRFEYAQFFNLTSTMSLICITLVFIFCLFAQNMPNRPESTRRQRHYGINVGINVERQIRHN